MGADTPTTWPATSPRSAARRCGWRTSRSTRARHQAVVHWASAWESECSPLATLLLGPDLAEAPPERVVVARMEEVAARAGGTISVERVDGGRDARWATAAGAPPVLAIRAFDRAGRHRRGAARPTARSTSEAKDAAVASEAEQPGTVDEDVEVGRGGLRRRRRAPIVDRPAASAAVPLAAMAGGARVGTLVHGVLEDTDFAASDIRTELHAALLGQPTWNPAGIAPGRASSSTDSRWRSTPRSVRSPAGAGSATSPRRDRLDELTFELPLAGGDTPIGGRRPSRRWPTCSSSTSRRTTRRRVRRAPARPAARPTAAGVPHRQHRRRAALPG